MRQAAVFCILAILCIAATVAAVGRCIFLQERMERARESSVNAIEHFLSGSDTLTNEVFAYADTRDAAHMQSYFTEANVTKKRDSAGAALRSAALGEEEIAAYTQAARASNELMTLEIHAMRLIAESEGMRETAMPEEVAAYRLDVEEQAFDDAQKYIRAGDLLFGRAYATKKDEILRSVQTFSYHVNRRFGALALQNMQRAWLIAAGGFSVFAVLALLCLRAMQRLERARRERLRVEVEHTKLRNAYFRVAVGQSGRHLAEYEFKSRACVVETGGEGGDGTPVTIQNLVETVVGMGYLAPESVDAYRAFFRRLEEGESPLTDDFRFIDRDGTQYWYRFHATVLNDTSDKPCMAVVTYGDCSEQRERELAYARFMRERATLPMDRIALFECNLTQNIDEGESGGLLTHFAALPHGSFDARTAAYAETCVHPEDRAGFDLFLNRKRLIGAFHDGVFSDTMDYRALQADGAYRWMRYEVQLVPYPDSNDIKLYAIVSDIQEEKSRELLLIERSERDAMTGTLNRATFIACVREAIALSPERPLAIFMTDIDGFKQINDTLGHDAGDEVLTAFAHTASALLRPTDLFGRVGGDEFMACLRDIAREDAARKKAEQLREASMRALQNGQTLTVSVGVALYPRDGATFETLYKHADTALYHAKQRHNAVSVYAPALDGSFASNTSPLPGA